MYQNYLSRSQSGYSNVFVWSCVTRGHCYGLHVIPVNKVTFWPQVNASSDHRSMRHVSIMATSQCVTSQLWPQIMLCYQSALATGCVVGTTWIPSLSLAMHWWKIHHTQQKRKTPSTFEVKKLLYAMNSFMDLKLRWFPCMPHLLHLWNKSMTVACHMAANLWHLYLHQLPLMLDSVGCLRNSLFSESILTNDAFIMLKC